MTVIKSMDYAPILSDPFSVAVKWDSVVMEGHAVVSEEEMLIIYTTSITNATV